MKPTLRLLGLLLAGAAFGPPHLAQAQTPTLEFMTGAGNPTGNGPSIANQIITFQNNSNNPTGATFVAYTPTTQATFSLTNQQFILPSTQISTQRGVSFGANLNNTGPLAGGLELFPKLSLIGTSANENYSSTSSTAGTGIDVATNNGVELFVSVEPLPATVPANQRYQYADLTISFNQAISNPVIHVTGLGGTYGGGIGFTTEFDLLTPGITLSKLSGSNELTVNATQILNNSTTPGGITGSGAASGSVLATTSPAGITSMMLRIYLRPNATGGLIRTADNSTHVADGSIISITSLAAVPPITGYVYEDVNYGGGAGRPRSASGTVGRPNARVELYNSAGNFVSATTTDATGLYSFTPTVGTYTVRVVNSSVTSSRIGAVASLLPVQTYNGTATRVGGEAPEKVDAGNGSTTLASLTTTATTAESIASVSVSVGTATTGADFGYNFDTVVNTNNTGQGSLRQFIVNANALGGEASLAQAGSYTNAVDLAAGSTAAGRAGVALPAGLESSIFMIPANLLTNNVAVITPTTVLPQITGPNTGINGGTQTFNIGNGNDVLLGIGGSVGTGSAITTLSRLNGPEVQLTGSTAVAIGFNIAGAGSRVRGMAIYGFGNGTDDDLNGNIVMSANNVTIADNAIGSTATSFTAPAIANVSSNVRVPGGTGGSFTNNLVGFAGGTGIYLATAVTGTTIRGNEIRGNGRIGTFLDGVDSHGSSTMATGNLFADTGAQGFDSFSSTGSNVVTGNTFTNNGTGNATSAPVETAAARFYGTGNIFSQNVLTGNYGAGVEVVNGSTTLISRNSIFNNGNVASANGSTASGQVGIDLVANGANENLGNSPFVTLNSATTTGGNGFLNYPILRTATIVGTNLVLTGYAKAGAIIELFAAQANPATVNATGANFGQGRTYFTTLTEGATTGVTDTDAGIGQTYGAAGATVNGFNQGTDTNANAFSFSIPLASLPGGTLPAGTVLTSTATLNNATSEFSGNVTAVAVPPLTGYVYEDVNYGGGAGRSRATLGTAAIGRPGAKVELYNNAGTLVGTAITDANGQYSFDAPVGTGYTVRVVNNSVLSSRTGATAASGSATAGYVSNQLAVQTYNGTTTRVGGENPILADAAANTGSQSLASLTSTTNVPESIATVSVGTGTSNAGPDFGFNFDVVTNTNNVGQGSLAQFIANANALGGENLLAQAGSNNAGTLPAGFETSIFMIPSGAAVPGQLAGLPSGLTSSTTNGVTSSVANINITAALPPVTGSNTSIDGTTQTINIGNTNNQLLGTGGTVGTNGTALAQLNGPEVQLKGAQNINGIAMVTGTNNTTVRGLSIYGFNTAIFGGVNNTGTRIEQNVIGASATSFTDPGAGTRTLGEGINLNDSDGGFVTNNLIGFNGGMGIWVQTNGNGSNNNSITGNEIRGNALVRNVGNGERLVFDGIELQGNSTGNTVSGNLITANTGNGIDSFGNGIGGNTITGNTISNNGVGVATNTGEEGSGLRVFGATNTTIISNNVLTGNNGSGVLVLGSANRVTISQNSTSGNIRLGIDLLTTGETNLASIAPGTPFWNGNTGTTTNVTLNDNGDTATGGNGLLNFPVLTTANVSGTSLVINGYARPGSLVELFLATPLTTDPTNSNRDFGQGSSYLISRTEGLAADDSNAGNGSYTSPVNGVNQGTDATNLFTFNIPLSSLTAGQRTALLSGNAILTSTATLANSTSEFSGNLALPITEVTTALAGPQTVNPGQPTGTYTATFTNEGPTTASTVTRTVTLPTGATNIFVNGVTYTPTTANVIDFGPAATLASGASTSFTFSFTPATTATGTVAITSNVTTTSSQGNNVAPDASTITAQVVPVANVVTTIVATTPSVAAGTLATATTPARFTVTFSNAGPNGAAGAVASVQLPVGLTNVTSTNNPTGVYSPTTGILTYNLTAGITSVITFDAPATGPLVATSTISTTTNEAGQTANNQASATIAVTPAFDLTTTLTGPVSAVIGDLVTLNVTTTNNGPAAAANAVQTVQLATGLTNVYVSNGGVYNPAATTEVIIANGVSYSVPAGGVIFPTLASLATGQTVANSVSFAMPATALAPTALVTPNTASSATTAGDLNTGNNAANLNAGATGSAAASVAVAVPQAGTANAYTTIRTSSATTTVGTAVTLTVTTGNNGPNQATGVTQTVQILPGFTTATLQVNGVTGSAPVNNVITFGSNGPTYNTLTGLVTFPTLTDGANGSASGTRVTNTIALTPSAATATTVATTGNNGQLLAMATVRTTNTDPVAADNVASVAVTIVPSADLFTSITGPTTALPGQLVQYTASFTNNGPLAATSVTETVQLPVGLGATGVTITDAAGNAVSGASYNSTTGVVTFPTIASDANGATQVFKLSFAAPAQSFAPRSSVNSTSTDAAPANNSATVATAVAASNDLATIINGPATAAVGNAVTYSVTTTNNGPTTASNTVTTLQLAAGFSTATLQVNGATGVLGATNIITYTIGAGATATTATYNTATGLVTFPALATLPTGTSAGNYVTFIMPNAAGGQTSGVASASASGIDPVATNNSASVATSVAPTTTTTADLEALVTGPTTAVAPGTTITLTATYSNIGLSAGVNVVPTLQLVPGLTTTTLPLVAGGAGVASGNSITYPNGASYNTLTGVLTFPTIASQAAGTAGNVSYQVQVVAPANGPLLASAVTTSNTSEPNTVAAQANNARAAIVTITPSFNEVTKISGPLAATAGTSQTYTVTTTNNGPSATSNSTTQTVSVPAGQTPTNITNSGVYSSANNTITWTIAAGQGAGSNGAVANSFTIVQPAAGITLTATVSVAGESILTDNTDAITTTPLNLAPLAYAVVNTLQSPQSNEAGGQATGILISPLDASDPEGAFTTNKYTLTSLPSSAQGTLYYLNGGTYTAVAANQLLTNAQAQTLKFKAAAGFVGNASFTYLTTDAAGNTSPAANYTIPVETDADAVAYTLTPVKGGANPYVAGDVIAYTTDANGAVYNAATSLVYLANGTLQPTTAGSVAPTNGVAAANEVAGTITGPGTTTATTLADIGLEIDATGRLVVAAAPNTSKLKTGTYAVQVLTTDVNGGQTSRTVSFVIGASPLPVVLTDFTAQAVLNRDALLNWHTASEQHNDHFEVQRSFDGTSFTNIGQVAGHGTTAAASAYSFTDASVATRATGPVYYRLRQVDTDGTATYSPLRTVSFAKVVLAKLALFPNPVQNRTSLDLRQLPASASYQAQLLDATGRQVRAWTLAGGVAQPLDVAELASGSYLLVITGTQLDGSLLKQTLRLTKE